MSFEFTNSTTTTYEILYFEKNTKLEKCSLLQGSILKIVAIMVYGIPLVLKLASDMDTVVSPGIFVVRHWRVYVAGFMLVSLGYFGEIWGMIFDLWLVRTEFDDIGKIPEYGFITILQNIITGTTLIVAGNSINNYVIKKLFLIYPKLQYYNLKQVETTMPTLLIESQYVEMNSNTYDNRQLDIDVYIFHLLKTPIIFGFIVRIPTLFLIWILLNIPFLNSKIWFVVFGFQQVEYLLQYLFGNFIGCICSEIFFLIGIGGGAGALIAIITIKTTPKMVDSEFANAINSANSE